MNFQETSAQITFRIGEHMEKNKWSFESLSGFSFSTSNYFPLNIFLLIKDTLMGNYVKQ